MIFWGEHTTHESGVCQPAALRGMQFGAQPALQITSLAFTNSFYYRYL